MQTLNTLNIKYTTITTTIYEYTNYNYNKSAKSIFHTLNNNT